MNRKLMRTSLIRILLILFVFLLLFQGAGITYAATDDFSDVPQDHWAHGYITELRRLGITDGVAENSFGLGKTLTRAEFTAFMCKLMKWSPVSDAGSFEDNRDPDKWYFGYIEAAVKGGAVKADRPDFLPDLPITREDMAVMIVRALGYDALGNRLGNLERPFPDVLGNSGYITVAKDLGIITGITETEFAPGSTATREQSAAMLIRMYRLLEYKAGFKNGFYAISSYSQIGAIDRMDSVCFGWSRLELTDGALALNATSTGSNEYSVPTGYQEPLTRAENKPKLLMAAVREADSPAIIGDETLRASAVSILSDAVLSGVTDDLVTFDGIVIDFEVLRGQSAKDNFSSFLSELHARLSPAGKLIYVAVHPQRRPGIAYYDGYDFKAIGEIADRIILMAHDYYPKSLTESDMARGVTETPAAPLDEVYYAVRSICDPLTGVSDRSKVLLQISFDSVQWKTSGGKTINQYPYRPAYSSIAERIQSGAQMGYDDALQSPYITFYNSEDRTDNIVWYEDARSVAAKLRLASLFGLGGVSYWRLGVIPDFSGDTGLNVLDVI